MEIDKKTIEMKMVVVVVMVKEKRMEESREKARRQEGRRCGWFARATLLCTVSSVHRGQARTEQARTGWSSSC